MGRPRKHHNHSNILPHGEKSISLSFNAEKVVPGIEEAAASLSQLTESTDLVASTAADISPPLQPVQSTYWVVMEERRAALNGALVTVAKGKIVRSKAIAARLMEQKIPLEEKTE